MLGISWDHISGQLRGILMALGGYAVGRGYVTEQTMLSIVGIVMAIAAALWSVKVNTQTAIVQSVAIIAQDPTSPVKGVVLESTPAGREMAENVGSRVVAPAGTVAATEIARVSMEKRP